MLIENVVSSMIGFINSAVLSGYSESAVAATGSAATVISMLSLLVTVLSNGVSVLLSNYIGANDEESARKTNGTVIILSVAVGGVLSLLTLALGTPIMEWMNLEGEVLEQAVVYFKIRAAFFFVPVLSGVVLAILRCYGYSKLTVLSSFLTIGSNLILNVWVIRFPQYSPLTGVEGIAVGSVISQALGLMLGVLFLARKGIGFQKPSALAEGMDFVKRILRIGVPSGVSTGAYSLSQVLTASFVALIGMSAVSAKVYYGNILLYSYLFSVCFGSANSLLIGRLMGARKIRRAKLLNRRLVKITCSVNLLVSLAILLLRAPLLSIFTKDAEILQLALPIFVIDLFAEQARGVSQVYEYALRGVGDMKFMMIVTTLSCWICGVGLAYLLSIPLGLGLVGCWIGMALDECIRAVASYLRWRKGAWCRLDVSK